MREGGCDYPWNETENNDARPRTPHPARRRRAVDPDAPQLPPAQGRLRGRAGGRRARGARPLRRVHVRPRRARRDDAAARRPRGVPPAAGAQLGADHHAHGQGRRDRQGPRPRARRRRLHHQAVLAARVPQPREGGAAARRDGAPRRGQRRGAARGPRAAHRLRQAQRARPRRGGPDHLRRVRDPDRARDEPRARVDARHAARAHLGRQRLPRPAHDRRPHPSPAREARARRQRAGVPLHRARSRLPLPRHGGLALRSLTLRLALPFCAIVIGAIAIVYLGVAPSLESSLRDQRLDTLAVSAQRFSPPIRRAIDASAPATELDRRVRRAADSSGARVTLLTVARSDRTPPLDVRSDSTAIVDITDLRFEVAERAARPGRIERGTEAGDTGRVAEAALPLRIKSPRSRRAAVYYVVVYSQPLEGIARGVELIRQRILIAGAIALVLGLL